MFFTQSVQADSDLLSCGIHFRVLHKSIFFGTLADLVLLGVTHRLQTCTLLFMNCSAVSHLLLHYRSSHVCVL